MCVRVTEGENDFFTIMIHLYTSIRNSLRTFKFESFNVTNFSVKVDTIVFRCVLLQLFITVKIITALCCIAHKLSVLYCQPAYSFVLFFYSSYSNLPVYCCKCINVLYGVILQYNAATN